MKEERRKAEVSFFFFSFFVVFQDLLKNKKKKKKEKHSSSLPLVPKGELGQVRVPVHAHDARGDVLLVQADQEHERAITNDFGLSFFFF